MLELFEASRFSTFEADVLAPEETDISDLETLCDRAGLTIEDWSRSIEVICKACSEGRPHDHHAAEAESSEWNPERRIAFAAESVATVEAVIREWSNAQRRAIDVRLALPAESC